MGPQETFAKRLRALMGERGLDPRTLARRADIGESTVYRYLASEREQPRADTIIALARALNCSADQLLAIDPDGQPARPISEEAVLEQWGIPKALYDDPKKWEAFTLLARLLAIHSTVVIQKFVEAIGTLSLGREAIERLEGGEQEKDQTGVG